MKLGYAYVMHDYTDLRTYYFARRLSPWVRKDILWALDAGEVAINPEGVAQIVIICWCIFMMHIYSWMDIYIYIGRESLENYAEKFPTIGAYAWAWERVHNICNNHGMGN